MYAIYESEMDSISGWNEISTVGYTLAGACASFAIGIWVQNCMDPTANPFGKALVTLGIPGGLFLGAVCALIAWRFGKKRDNELNRIKSESRAVQPSNGVTVI